MRPLTRAVAGLAVVLPAPMATLSAQSLQQQNDEILSELKQIRQLLEKLAGSMPGMQPTTAPAAKVRLANFSGYTIGRPEAPLTMVEFTDLQCPFCHQFHLTAFEQLKKNYIDTGKLRYVSLDFPLDAIHPLALAAAKATRCAGDQEKFWEMRHQVLLNNPQLKPELLTTLAKDLNLDMETFQHCVDMTSRFDADIQKDAAAATSVGVSGTPSFVIGRTTANGLDGVLMVGAQPYSTFEAKLKELLTAP